MTCLLPSLWAIAAVQENEEGGDQAGGQEKGPGTGKARAQPGKARDDGKETGGGAQEGQLATEMFHGIER